MPLALAVALAALTSAPPVAVSDDVEDVAIDRARVAVVIAGPRERSSEQGDVLVELLERLALEVELALVDELDADAIISARPDARPALAYVFVDVHAEGSTVIIGDGRYERMLVRRLGPAPVFDEATREEIAAIVVSAVEALRDGAQIGVARRELIAEPTPVVSPAPPVVDEAPLPKPASTPPPRRAVPFGIEVAGSYRAEALTRTRARHSLEFGVIAHGRGRLALELAAWIGASLPLQTDSTPRVRVLGGSGRAQLGMRIALGRGVAWTFAGGFGVDVLHARVPGNPGTVAAIPVARARTGLHVDLQRRWTVALLGGLEFDMVDTRVIDRASGRALFDPWRAWPGLVIALGGRVWP